MADISSNAPKTEHSKVVVDEKSVEAQDHRKDDAASIRSESSGVQAGVQKAMILKKAWSRTTLAMAFARCVHYSPHITSPADFWGVSS